MWQTAFAGVQRFGPRLRPPLRCHVSTPCSAAFSLIRARRSRIAEISCLQTLKKGKGMALRSLNRQFSTKVGRRTQALSSRGSRPKSSPTTKKNLDLFGGWSPGRKAGPQPSLSIHNLLEILELPTETQFPSLWKKHSSPKDTLYRIISKIQGRYSCSTRSAARKSPIKRSTVTVNLPKKQGETSAADEISAVGEAYESEAAAEQAACLHAIAKLHEAGWLATASAPKIKKTTPQMLKDGNAAAIDTFNYAARYGCIPHYSGEKSGRHYKFFIRMPEHGIDVCELGRSFHDAELLANFEFKKQAENYHLRQGTDSLIIRDKSTLNAENAFDFLAFCRSLGENCPVQTTVADSNKFGGIFETTVTMNGENVVERVVTGRGGSSTAGKIARLLAAVTLAKRKPHLLAQFESIGGKFIEKTNPVDLSLTRKSLEAIKRLNDSTADICNWEQEKNPLTAEQRVWGNGLRQTPLTGPELELKSKELQRRLTYYQEQAHLEKLRHARSELPMSRYAHQVEDLVRNNIYCVIVGATGSGKTTQVPQILFDQAIQDGRGASCNIICTQPRRIAATSVARRVAQERAEKLQETVGYHVRFDPKLPKPSGSILFCTTGILLQQLRVDHDEVYDRASHLVIDEVHERDIILDFLLIMIKKTMALRVAQGKTIPRVVLMSATIDAERFAEYFKDSLPGPGGVSTSCPTLSVPGRTFPVKELYLTDILDELERDHGAFAANLYNAHAETKEFLAAEAATTDHSLSLVDANNTSKSIIDWKGTVGDDGNMVADKGEALVPLGLAAVTIAHLGKTTSDGAILVFLPGLEHITKLNRMLREFKPLGVDFDNEAKFKIFMLHSSIQDQRTVFDPVPEGCRKIILSTNIAETSITIPDVQFVVDTGKSREKRYDQTRRTTQLQCTWISKSNVKQRAGRAGRVQNGSYYALYTKSRFDSMRAIGLPELLRSELLEVCLDVKAQHFRMPVRDFLAEAIEPPAGPAVDNAMKSLQSLGALTEHEELTPLGRLLASLPVHPSLGKMIVLGIIFKCLEPMIILGVAAGERPLIVNPPGESDRVNKVRERLANSSCSDHVMLLEAFYMARRAERDGFTSFVEKCKENYVHMGAFKSIQSNAQEVLKVLYESGLVPGNALNDRSQYGGPRLNENSSSDQVVKALLLAGLYPNIAMQRPMHRRIIFRTRDESLAGIHLSSVNVRALSKEVKSQVLLTFSNLALTGNNSKRVEMRDTTFVSPLMAVLFAGQLSVGQVTRKLEVDEWLVFFAKEAHRGLYDHDTVVDEILKLRQRLDKMLAITFDDLAKKEPLVNDHTRGLLANGIAEILKLDARYPGKAAPYIGAGRSRPAAERPRMLHAHNQHSGPWLSTDRSVPIAQLRPRSQLDEAARTGRNSFAQRGSRGGGNGILSALKKAPQRSGYST